MLGIPLQDYWRIVNDGGGGVACIYRGTVEKWLEIGAGLALGLISFPTERDVRPEDIDPDTLFNLGLAYGPSVAIFGLFCIVVFSTYNITRTSHQETLEILRERRKQKPLADAQSNN